MNSPFHHPRYALERLIATGGMGEVWAATDTLLEREVAVKVLKREYAEDAVFRARFAAEARNAGSLQHPHVASVLDYGEIAASSEARGDTPTPFLVMELVDGQPLSALLAGGRPLDPEVAAELMAQAGEGVAAAHALGIVHRDVKPGNLLVTGTGQVKVTDFGVARAADTVPLTVTGHIVGTPHYLSPEQAEGGVATPASDVYSLGIVLYECLVGAKPFVGESPVGTALMQIRDPLPEFPDTVPKRLQDIARVATAKDPGARYTTASAFAAALRDATPDTQTFLVPGGAATAASGSVAHRSRKPLGYLAAALALLLVVGGGWALLTGENPPEPPAAAATDQPEDDRVRVRAAAYVGKPFREAARRLRSLGLTVDRKPRQNPGGRIAGNVAAVSPSGMVEPGSKIVLTVWGPPPVAQPAPSPSAGASSGTGSTGSQAGPGSGGSAAGPGAGTDNDKSTGENKSKNKPKSKGGKGGGKGKSGKGKGGKR